jgi:hypothetical protein
MERVSRKYKWLVYDRVSPLLDASKPQVGTNPKPTDQLTASDDVGRALIERGDVTFVW